MSDKIPMVAALVLAAGAASRFGSDKRRARLADGRTLLGSSLDAPMALLAEAWLVLRPEDDRQALGVPAETRVVRSETARAGMGHSLASGIDELLRASSATSAAIFLGDMPWLRRDTLVALAAHAAAHRIVVPSWHGRRGHPVIFGRQFWPELSRLDGDTGARALLQAHAAAVQVVEVDDLGVVLDVDTPESLAQQAARQS
ncbi:nucleotidyltransferase family protein [Pseudomonas oligotrophica]|uniref:nucleotidyltransferase family protein n=1 Tax=Pseudomonas oligotrophica TaxID=2912055 RepID=UPI001F19909F|nr:nucleotidyltransferase family protein [Pseudomonas oligotrophica]MCF7202379.1 nucleotidyltransferase family protein [Pseudomonas oligotrophica]